MLPNIKMTRHEPYALITLKPTQTKRCKQELSIYLFIYLREDEGDLKLEFTYPCPPSWSFWPWLLLFCMHFYHGGMETPPHPDNKEVNQEALRGCHPCNPCTKWALTRNFSPSTLLCIIYLHNPKKSHFYDNLGMGIYFSPFPFRRNKLHYYWVFFTSVPM